ncbi:MAG: UDP-N-acetylmuramate dehydrogenase [Clostridia bacterium]|nr:UDP-N-acetylmuramate dehydrogenase [Clostridia bacterium]
MDNFEFEKDISLKDFCTFKIGGSAKFLSLVKNNTQLIDVCLYCQLHNIKYKIIGLGANLLFDDSGFDGMIIVNKSNRILFRNVRGSFDSAQDDTYYFVYVDSGVNVTNLIMKCYMRSLCGFERLAGIPSTVGGAVVNSLGAFETNFSDFIEYVECYHKSDLTKKLRFNHDDCNFGYRTSLFKNGDYIITRVKLRLFKDDKTLIQQRIKDAIEKKKSTQPLDQFSAGSVFKRGNIIPAKVIDELGLKGTKIGGAEISTKHAGFIVNTNSATSKDIKQLISLIQNEVKTAYNEELEPEIEFVEY